ncbi:MAG: hypothetical protein AB1346_04650 [Thermodesulfobacteriota bacterium]
MLLPLLRADLAPPRNRIAEWTHQLVKDCRSLLSFALPMRPAETEFFDRLNGQGEITPELLTGDPALRETIRSHPGLRWKVFNVRKHRKLDEGGE